MLLNVEMLKKKILDSGLTIKEFAESVGIDKSTYYRKLRGSGGGFYLWQIKAIIKTLKLTNKEMEEIFLP